MNKLIALLRTQGVLILFGFVITISLFLGDGKQPLIDVVWACEVLLLYAIYFLQNRKLRVLPRALRAAWATLLGYCVIRTVFSDSVGYSISTTVRLLDAYLVYRLFYSLADKKNAWHGGLGVMLVGAVATIASFVYILFPRFIPSLPQMNLLYASYGHNQLAGLLLFGIPLVITRGVPVPTWCKKTLLVLFLSGMVFSFARGAWMLLAAYFAFLLVTKRLVGKFNTSIVIVFIAAVTGLLVTMFLLAPRFAHGPPILNNDWLYKQTIKPPVYETRVQYWLQALRAIRERPMFGSGPGTFYLQSKRLQRTPLSYSWFAHSFVLEQLVEVGLIGVVLWGILFVVQGRLLIRSRDHALLSGVILTFLYSLFEYNLNFLVIWLLFWAALGLLLGAVVKPDERHTGGRPWVMYLSLFVVGAYYASSFTSFLFSKRAETVFLIAPYDTDNALRFLDEKAKNKSSLTKTETFFLRVFHKNDPEAALSLAEILDPPETIRQYEIFLKNDPKNKKAAEIYREYMKTLLFEQDNKKIGKAVENYLLLVLPDTNKEEILTLDLSEQERIFRKENLDPLFERSEPRIAVSKTLYLTGLSVSEKSPKTAEKFFMAAAKLSPEWSFYYIELAALYWERIRNESAAEGALAWCRSHKNDGTQCENMSTRTLPALGFYRNAILSISPGNFETTNGL